MEPKPIFKFGVILKEYYPSTTDSAPNMAQVVIVVTFLNSRDDSKILEKRSFELFCIKKYLLCRFSDHNRR